MRAGTKGANNKDYYTADDLIGKIRLKLDKPGYIGEWLINGIVADRVPINTVVMLR